MKSLQPSYSKLGEFKNADLLVPDDHLAQWIVNVGRALNDLLVVQRRIENDFSEGNSQGTAEAIYDMRAAATHAWEFAKFLRLSEAYSEDVREFLNKTLHPPALKVYRQALEALSEPEDGDGGEPQERDFQGSFGSSARSALSLRKARHEAAAPGDETARRNQGRAGRWLLIHGRGLQGLLRRVLHSARLSIAHPSH
jgi:hypothetical protein